MIDEQKKAVEQKNLARVIRGDSGKSLRTGYRLPVNDDKFKSLLDRLDKAERESAR
jgi:hypothetical protein